MRPLAVNMERLATAYALVQAAVASGRSDAIIAAMGAVRLALGVNPKRPKRRATQRRGAP